MTEMSQPSDPFENRYLSVDSSVKNASRFLDLVPMMRLWNIGSM